MEMFYNIRKYYRFNGNEIKGIIISVLMIAFMLSFKNWGTDAFDVTQGLFNFIGAVLIVALGYIVHLSLQRFYAFKLGYIAEYRYNIYGLVGGLILTFASNGYLFLLIPGHCIIKHMPRLRLGEFRYGMNMWEYAKIAAAGPVGNILLAMFFKAFSFLGSPLIDKAITINIILALFSLVPLPGNDGLDIFFGSRFFYVFLVIFLVLISIGLLLLSGVWSFVLISLTASFIGLTVYFIFVEEGLKY